MGLESSCMKKNDGDDAINQRKHNETKNVLQQSNYDDELQQLQRVWSVDELKDNKIKDENLEYNDNTDDKKKDDNSNNVELEKDESLQNIIAALKYYQTILNDDNYNDLISQYFIENKNIIQDYTNILKEYLSNAPNKNDKTFEQIYDIMSKQIKCDIKNCKQYSRNNRNREKQSQSDDNKQSDNDKTDQFKVIFYTDTMDTIHCYFMHSYDVGFRMRCSELTEINDASQDLQRNKQQDVNDLDNSSLLSQYVDDRMKKFNTYIQNKRESLREIRGKNRAQNNKFMTSVNEETLIDNDKEKKEDDQVKDENDEEQEKEDEDEEDEEEDEESEDKMGSFSFGYRYYYWRQKKFRERWYIPKTMCKYQSFKDELLNNIICKLSFESYNIAMEKAKHYAECDYIKQSKTSDPLCLYYGISKHSTLDIEHIMSLILYTDFDSLSYSFSSTFRRQISDNDKNKSMASIQKEVKERNAEYWHWSKALRETVELWGTQLNSRKNQIKVFYHGTSYLIFDKLVAKFSSPTSTTSSIQVATIFAKESGIILELEKYEGYGSYLRYFDVNFISAFSNEDEKLFFGGKRQLRLGSIRNIARNEDYRIFIKALTICQIAIKGMNNTLFTPTKTDFAIIDRLCKHKQNGGIYKDYTNKFPDYVNKLFKLFAKNQISIAFNFGHIKKYIGILKIFGFVDLRGMLKFDYLCQTFINAQYITILENPAKPFIVTFTADFATKLLVICDNMNENKDSKIKTILYKSCIEIDDKLDKKEYEERFGEKNWTLLFEENKTRYNQYQEGLYSMTLKKGYSGSITEVDKLMIKKIQNKRMKVMNYFDDNDVHLNTVSKVSKMAPMNDTWMITDRIEPYDDDKRYSGKIEPPKLFDHHDLDDLDDLDDDTYPPIKQISVENEVMVEHMEMFND